MAKGTSTRLSNGAAFFPHWVWENLNIKEGEEFDFELETKTKGPFVAYWKKKGT